jgi:hypothetical protein
VERISTFTDGVNFTRPENIGTNQSTGLEVNGKYQPARWLSFNGDLNYNYFNRQGEWQDVNFDFTADQWSGKLTAKLKLPEGFDVEFTGHYRSQVETVQGSRAGNEWLDLGMRKKILGGKGVINFSVRDVFVSRIEENFVNQPDFSVYNRRFRGRFVTLGFSYGFGKGEAMEYQSRRR